MTGVKVAVRRFVLERDNHRCRHCGTSAKQLRDIPGWAGGPRKLQIDHLIPKFYGGGDDFWNLCAACPDCNLGKQHRRIDYALVEENLALVDVLGVLLGLLK